MRWSNRGHNDSHFFFLYTDHPEITPWAEKSMEYIAKGGYQIEHVSFSCPDAIDRLGPRKLATLRNAFIKASKKE